MAGSTPKNFTTLRDLLATKPDADILRIYLQQNTIGLLKDAMLVTLHRLYSARPPYHLTELGITTYDRRAVNNGQPITSGPHAQNLLANVWSLHIRIREHAHLPSAPANVPNRFHFGTTTFATKAETLDLLHQIWHQPIQGDTLLADEGVRPIVCMYLGSNDSLSVERAGCLSFEPRTLDNTVAMLDVQNIAVQSGITMLEGAALEHLLPQFKITPYDQENGGNAAMYATIVAMCSALRKDLYASMENQDAQVGQFGQSRSLPAESVASRLMELPTPPSPFGILVYCSHCGSDTHDTHGCMWKELWCKRCSFAKEMWRRANALTHIEGLCVFERVEGPQASNRSRFRGR